MRTQKIKALLVFVFLITTLNCVFLQQYQPRYGKEFNQERQKIGLPLIPDHWEVIKVRRDESTWVNPERERMRDNQIPVHASKYINYSLGNIVSETDTYYGREDYTTIDGTFREELVITYNFQIQSSMDKLGWEIELYNHTTASEYETPIDLEKAEEILEGWGIERLDYE